MRLCLEIDEIVGKWDVVIVLSVLDEVFEGLELMGIVIFNFMWMVCCFFFFCVGLYVFDCCGIFLGVIKELIDFLVYRFFIFWL